MELILKNSRGYKQLYSLVHWNMYNYDNLIDFKAVDRKYNPKTKEVTTYSQYIIMVDTETSKEKKDTYKLIKQGKKVVKKYDQNLNYVVAFTISIRHKGENIVTLYGNKPNDCIKCIKTLVSLIVGNHVLMFIHNLSYDYVFLRKFLFDCLGVPEKVLNIDKHYPISMVFSNGLELRDSLILSGGRTLEKWGSDLNVEHKKAIGFWDYDQIRTQEELFDIDELEYIEHDTLCGVECIDKLCRTLKCKLKDIPLTATGIARRVAFNIGRKNKAKLLYNKLVLNLEQYNKFKLAFHGGYTHCNRFLGGQIFQGVECYDFNSSYPYCACAFKFPMTKFIELRGYYTINDILSNHDKFAYLVKATFVNIRLRNSKEQMPVLQVSKNLASISHNDMFIDNGRILESPIYECYCTDIDLELINKQYSAEYVVISDVHRSEYGYLPRWFTDHVYKLYEDKCKLKGGDPVLYDLTKAQLNSVAYGMLAMANIKELIVEDYATGEYKEESGHENELYQKFIENRKNIYPYQWSLWITSYAMSNLHKLGECCSKWIYSDTDSCFSNSWNTEKIKEYNDNCEKMLAENGYKPIEVNGKLFYLGKAVLDKTCKEFKALHSKCYAYKNEENEIQITIAGVPKKKGKKALKDLSEFNEGFIFSGSITGKLTHVYNYIPDIFIKNNIIYGDSINLIPCDYEVKPARIDFIDDFENAEYIVDNIFRTTVYSSAKNYD